ncbi:gliotoxin biosynthesis protein GliK [Colletotrichum scovillei]|uniref:gamma-glutamylcyclotransferase n=1 Tax=Colletotrichum scovillei TaxID=1209932 RepID=A0A9P7UMP2_9PEZI|nr:gliotoxin biosynthesis protein GliK [Colletotrichum scovillei]KAG7077861.1 gliotoxin biosynthesis protein GliK [Colletotrichum scovillei]KAG7085030.1 gliotoxin biosynthesis protein GliK [Colletotrichum scovillei]
MTTSLPQEPICLLRRLKDLATLSTSSAPSKKSYPSIKSIPRTSSSRLAAAAASPDSPSNDASSHPTAVAIAAEQTSVLYLAYGSNLSAETFLGARGIRPISQVNVSAPGLSLVFDLPGLPYTEPCFANSAPRKIPNLPDPSDPPKFPPVPPLPPPSAGSKQTRSDNNTATTDLGWDKGLIGVVYEVTPQDYATIVATEGGGSSYKDILTPCIPLPPRVSVPEKPPIDIPRPFLAHTLFSPSIPDADPEEPDHATSPHTYTTTTDDDDKTPTDPRKKWYYRFLRPTRRPDPTYAQPSPRYLNLITSGAAEHELPDDYQRWLNSLVPYTPTSPRQKLAQWLLKALFLPVLLVFFALNKKVANKEGKVPVWLGVTLGVVFNLLWMAYDAVLRPAFGDGERTQEEEEEGDEKRGWVRARSWSGRVGRGDEEKMGLLENMD